MTVVTQESGAADPDEGEQWQKTIYRYEIPVDGQPHDFEMTGGDVVHVGCRQAHIVEFWAQHYPGSKPIARTFQVFGTGMPMPNLAHVCGTTYDGGYLVWHLAELTGLDEHGRLL